jgi:membrane-bound ClpP family serine protease
MKGIDNWSLGAGIVLLIGGLVLMVVSYITSFIVLIYAIPAIVLGIVILLTLRKQEYVEPINMEGGKGK